MALASWLEAYWQQAYLTSLSPLYGQNSSVDIGHIAWSQRISKRKKLLAARPPLKQTFFTHPLQILWATIVSQIVVFYQLPPQEPLVEEWLELRRLAEPLEAELLLKRKRRTRQLFWRQLGSNVFRHGVSVG
jgi:hypothetical protein